jgi:hypothetical protein
MHHKLERKGLKMQRGRVGKLSKGKKAIIPNLTLDSTCEASTKNYNRTRSTKR